MSLFHRCFSNILIVKTNYLVFTEVEHWLKMGQSTWNNYFFKKRFPKLVNGIATRIDINFIVDYLHAFNIFLMNSWYAEEFYVPPVSEKTRYPKEFLKK